MFSFTVIQSQRLCVCLISTNNHRYINLWKSSSDCKSVCDLIRRAFPLYGGLFRTGSAVILWMKATHCDLTLTSSSRRWCVQTTSLWGRWWKSPSIGSMTLSAPPVMSPAGGGVSSDGLLSWPQRNHLQEADEQIVFLLDVCFVDEIRRKVKVCFHEFLFLYS